MSSDVDKNSVEALGELELTISDSGSHDLLLGQTIEGKYLIEHRLGAGGMGIVYRARHILIDRVVAIKVLHKHLASNEEFLQRFQHEARVASKLNHPNAISIHDYGVFEGSPYLVMEFAQGDTLKDVIERGGALPLSRIRSILEQIGSALTQAHRLGIVHRDLKPENILLTVDSAGGEFARLFDFGIAKVLTQNDSNTLKTRVGTFCGTPKYAAPEQVLEKPVDHRADIYTVGVILYEALSGEVPFDAPSYMELLVKHVNQEPVPLRKFKPGIGIPEALDQLVMRCLAKNPDDRFQTVEELLQALRTIDISTPDTHRSGLSFGPLAAGVGVFFAIFGIAIYFLLPDSDEPSTQIATLPPVDTVSVSPRETPTPAVSPTPTAAIKSNDSTDQLLDDLANSKPIQAGPTPAVSPTPELTPTPAGSAEAPLITVTEATTPTATAIAVVITADPSPTPAVTDEIPQPPPAVVTARRVDSLPTDAEVLRGGAVVGRTPLDISLSTREPEEIVLRKEGYNDTKITLDSESSDPVLQNLEQALDPKKAKAQAIKLYNQGQELYRKKQYADAAKKFSEVVSIRSDAVASLIALGNCYTRLGNKGEALRYLKQAVKNAPDYALAHYNLAAFYAIENLPRQSVDSLKKAIALDPKAAKSAREEPDFRSLKRYKEFNDLVAQ